MIRQGKITDAKLIMKIIQDAVADLDSKGIFQWDSLYPNQAVVKQDLESGAMSVYEDQGIIKGMIVLNEQQDKEYQNPAWKFSFGKQLVVHRLCVDPCYQSQGIARALMEFAEQTAEALEYQSIRLDTFVNNKRAYYFYRKLGYQVVGTVEFRKGTFYCMEKGMANLRLIKPNPDFEKEYSEMIDDWKVNDENHIPWFIDLGATDFPAMVEKLDGLSKGIGIPDGFVANSTYWLVDDHRKIFGAINIRHQLNDFYLNYGGQVGYGVRPTERRKGYAKEMLRQGLKICKDMGFNKVLLCCNKSNLGSVKTIIENGGALDSEAMFNGEEMQRYWISLV